MLEQDAYARLYTSAKGRAHKEFMHRSAGEKGRWRGNPHLWDGPIGFSSHDGSSRWASNKSFCQGRVCVDELRVACMQAGSRANASLVPRRNGPAAQHRIACQGVGANGQTADLLDRRTAHGRRCPAPPDRELGPLGCRGLPPAG